MTGRQYEQFVRAVILKQLAIPPEALRSSREPGVTLPGAPGVMHQIDLLYVEETEFAKYVTLIECKYRSAAPVDQEEIAKLAFVKQSARASKAILVTNTEFTSGAKALAEAEQIALLVVRPSLSASELAELETDTTADAILSSVEEILSSRGDSYEMTVVCKLTSSPGEGGRDLVAALASDPTVRRAAEAAIRDPEIRGQVERLARENPDLANKALGFLRRGRF